MQTLLSIHLGGFLENFWKFVGPQFILLSKQQFNLQFLM
jgi:hypothetical protein